MSYFLEDPNATIRDKIFIKTYRAIKGMVYFFFPTMNKSKNVIFIVGCQRSGTTLMQRMFEKDFDIKVYGEVSKLSSEDKQEGVRLNPLDEVRSVIEKDKTPFVVLKPLVETQNIPNLLQFFSNSKAIFMYRHYRDVAASNLKRFGLENGIKNIRPIIENDEENWRSERVPKEVRDIIIKFFSEDMNPFDAAALFWYVRNRFLLDLQLYKNKKMKLVKYEDLASSPVDTMNSVYKFIGHENSKHTVFKEVNQEALGRGEELQLSPDVEFLCEDLLSKIDSIYRKHA